MHIFSALALLLGVSISIASPTGPKPEDYDGVSLIVKKYLPPILKHLEIISSHTNYEFDDVLANLGLVSLPGRPSYAGTNEKRDSLEQIEHIKSAVGTLYNGAVDFSKQGEYSYVVEQLEKLRPILDQ
ncbi:hypothetical protein JCM33374_g3348 [Metschnikowia sp. JCM 33374]|nr:hypothetical protein JCM33374_g3348 [Metschnikowia sp. JCM 33374]